MITLFRRTLLQDSTVACGDWNAVQAFEIIMGFVLLFRSDIG